MKSVALKEKFLGAVLGTAAGDGIGAGFEGHRTADADQVRAAADQRNVLTYTDDTHMMIGIAESLIERRGFDGAHMAARFADNFFQEPFRGYGPGPPRIFEMIRAGQRWDSASESIYPGGSFGNGAAMRIAPVGIFYHDDRASLRQVAYQSSHITHAHELGKEGAALEAFAVATATNLNPGQKLNQESFIDTLVEFTQHDIYRRKLRAMANLLDGADRQTVVEQLGHGIEAFNSVPAAIFSFLKHAGSFKQAVLYAVSLGGDTDTIAAMTGAVSGAYLGSSAIPPRWLDKIENRAYLEDLATALWNLWAGQ